MRYDAGREADRPAVVTVGETMALLTAPAGRGLRGGSTLPIGMGGAESNVAIGLARLGVRTMWISRLGDDAFGAMIAHELRGEGVIVRADVDPMARTGLMVKEHRNGRPWRVRYYRDASAASRLVIEDLDAQALSSADILHVTGITAALSDSALAVLRHSMSLARDHNTLISFDVNYRSALWPPSRARPVLRSLCDDADVVFAGMEEAQLILDSPSTDPGELVTALAQLGAPTVVLKLGDQGALASWAGQLHSAPAQTITVVDPVGAGDAFVAGFLSAQLDGKTVNECLRQANQLGAAVCQVPGDWEGLPTREELTAMDLRMDVIR